VTQPLSLNGRICLVTGATAGIGTATARALATLGATVIVHGRDQDRTEQTVSTLREATENPRVEAIVADFASLDAVRGMAADLHHRFDRLHVLINNAGAMFPTYRETADGFEMTMAVNHLAPFLLTNLVLDLLQSRAPARVVNVASGAHRREALDFDDLHSRGDYEARAVYGRSKLMNVLFTRELARRLAGTGVTANALAPGLVHTDFGVKDGMGEEQQATMLRGISPEEGAQTSVYLATAPEVAEVTGGYFQKSAPGEISEAARDDETARRLWEVSAELVSLSHPA
jgi:retinol dehydrogenase 12